MKNILATLLGLLMCSIVFGEDIEAGKSIFNARCSACHAIDSKLVGPALKDVDKRHDNKWLVSFIRSSSSLIKQGDQTAISLFNQNNHVVMPDHTDLKEADVMNLISFIKDEGTKVIAKVNSNRPVEGRPNDKPIRFLDMETWSIYTLSFLLIFMFLFALVSAKSVLNG